MSPVTKHRRNGKTRPRKSFPSGTADGPKVSSHGVGPYAGKRSFVTMWRSEIKSAWRKLRKNPEVVSDLAASIAKVLPIKKEGEG